MLKMHSMTIRHLAKVIGKLLLCMVACPFGQLHYRYLERCKVRALCLNHGKWSARCRLGRKAHRELAWWAENIKNTKATHVFRKDPDRPTIFMDACKYGWGCFFDSSFTNGHFSESELPLSINTKETLAILYGIRSFLHRLKGQSVMILSDNTTAISYIRKMGGMQSELRSKIVTDLWHWQNTTTCGSQ